MFVSLLGQKIALEHKSEKKRDFVPAGGSSVDTNQGLLIIVMPLFHTTDGFSFFIPGGNITVKILSYWNVQMR